MKLIKLKPNTAGTRHTIKIDKSLLLKKKFIFKNLIQFNHRFVGRSSNNGRITIRHKGGGAKKKYISLKNTNEKNTSLVIAIAYDSNRTSFISLNFDLKTNSFFTLLSPDLSFSGFIHSCNKSFKKLNHGYRTNLRLIPAGSLINNVSVNMRTLSQYSRSAGTACQIVQKTKLISKIRLPSGKIIDVLDTSFATIGNVSNTQNKLICIGKAGKNRLRGIRPSVRGIAMNPVDHPHGGRTNSGFVYTTPWGIPTKGVKTKNKKNE